MKKWLVMAGLCLMMISVLLVSCSSPGQPDIPTAESTPLDYADSVDSTDLGDELNGIGLLGAKRQEVVDKLGAPNMTGDIVINGKKQRAAVMEYDGFHYSLKNDSVQSFVIMSGGATAKGIVPGDGAEQAVEAYGSSYYTRTLGDDKLMGFIDKERDIVMEFILRDDQIALIIVSLLSSYR
ncbi:hypothetical protein ACX93W_13085 [Paenibacillus sp. CAU 1782]